MQEPLKKADWIHQLLAKDQPAPVGLADKVLIKLDRKEKSKARLRGALLNGGLSVVAGFALILIIYLLKLGALVKMEFSPLAVSGAAVLIFFSFAFTLADINVKAKQMKSSLKAL